MLRMTMILAGSIWLNTETASAETPDSGIRSGQSVPYGTPLPDQPTPAHQDGEGTKSTAAPAPPLPPETAVEGTLIVDRVGPEVILASDLMGRYSMLRQAELDGGRPG